MCISDISNSVFGFSNSSLLTVVVLDGLLLALKVVKEMAASVSKRPRIGDAIFLLSRSSVKSKLVYRGSDRDGSIDFIFGWLEKYSRCSMDDSNSSLVCISVWVKFGFGGGVLICAIG